MSFWGYWCTPVVEKPKRSDLKRWEFKNGSVAWAKDCLAAIEQLSKVNTTNFWSSEIEPGIWDVQFEKDDEPLVIVINVKADTGFEAAKSARWLLHLDHQMEEIVRIK
jgi:hypothetical protein